MAPCKPRHGIQFKIRVPLRRPSRDAFGNFKMWLLHGGIIGTAVTYQTALHRLARHHVSQSLLCLSALIPLERGTASEYVFIRPILLPKHLTCSSWLLELGDINHKKAWPSNLTSTDSPVAARIWPQGPPGQDGRPALHRWAGRPGAAILFGLHGSPRRRTVPLAGQQGATP